MPAKVIFKFGTQAQYLALETKQDNALYFLTDTGELYRGSVPYGKSKIYQGVRVAYESDQAAITATLNGASPVEDDIIVLTNPDNSCDIFIYNQSGSWVSIGQKLAPNAISNINNRIATLEDTVNGNASAGIVGLSERINNIGSIVGGAFHFQGTTNDLDSVTNPNEGDVWQVGSKEYAWNGSIWVELGDTYDLSNYVTSNELSVVDGKIDDLIAQVGHPAIEADPLNDIEAQPATGFYYTLQTNASSLIPLFNGATAGLVPVATQIAAANRSTYVLNANGDWIQNGNVGELRIGNTVYNNVSEYVTAAIATELEWHPIDES